MEGLSCLIQGREGQNSMTTACYEGLGTLAGDGVEATIGRQMERSDLELR